MKNKNYVGLEPEKEENNVVDNIVKLMGALQGYAAVSIICLSMLGIAAMIMVAVLQEQALSLAAEPVETTFDCSGAVDGNFQLDGEPMRVVGTHDFWGRPLVVDGLMMDDLVTSGPRKVSTPDFTQLKVESIKLRCRGSVKGPAMLLGVGAENYGWLS